MRTVRSTTTLSGRLSRRRGAILLFWTIVVLPLIWLVGALSVDYARVMITQKRATALAESSAIAGVTQFAPQCPGSVADNRCLDPNGVATVVAETNKIFLDEGALPGATNVVTTAVLNDNGPVIPAGKVPSVSVTVTYTVPNLMFFGLTTLDLNNSSVDGSVTRVAYVCDPNVPVAGVNVSSCQRPR